MFSCKFFDHKGLKGFHKGHEVSKSPLGDLGVTLPKEKRLRKPRQILLLLIIPEYKALHLPLDQLLHLLNQGHQKILINLISHQHKINLFVIQPPGNLAGDVSLGYIPQLVNHFLNQLIQPHRLLYDRLDIVKQRMLLVGTEDFLVLVHRRDQQPGLLKTV